MDILDLNATVHLSGADEAVNMAIALHEKVKEVKTMAIELASLVDELEVKVKMQENSLPQYKITLPSAEEFAKYLFRLSNALKRRSC